MGDRRARRARPRGAGWWRSTGPNGAGTTAVRILTTGASDSSMARVTVVGEGGRGAAPDGAGRDARRAANRTNLVMIGRLSGLRTADAEKPRRSRPPRAVRASDRPDRVMKGYSGGMHRRLDLAAGLDEAARLFLDEPTTGLESEPVVIRELVSDAPADDAVPRRGRRAGRPDRRDRPRSRNRPQAASWKGKTGGARLEVTLSEADDAASIALEPLVGSAACQP